MGYGSPDRVPLFREGMRSEVIQSWKTQGLGSEEELACMFHYDQREEIAPDLYARSQFIFKSRSTIDLERFRKDLNPDDNKRLPKRWKSKVRAWRERDNILMLRVHEGFFLTMGVEGWNTFSNAIELLADNPSLVQEIMQIQGEFSASLTERILSEVKVDAVIFGEPISGAHGPLISPKMYEDIILSSYEPLLDVIEKFKVQTIILRTYANSKALLPIIMKTRINCLWASESNMKFMDYRLLRDEFGKDLRLIGGIDTDILMQGKDAIRHEIETKLPPLLEQGGYIPLADARIRKYIPFENYVYYRQLLERVAADKGQL
jgi:uroporphyrinogen decarboxylase